MNKIFFCCTFVFFALAFFTLAHLEGGSHVENGPYVIDLGHDPAKIIAGEPIYVSFNLINKTTNELITPSLVWLRISSEKEIVFSGNFYPKARHVDFTYTFPKPGHYTLQATFFDSKSQVVSQEFTVDVKRPTMHYVYAFVLLILFVYLWKRKK